MAAGNSVQYTFRVNADTKQAKQDIENLLKSLNRVQTQSINNFSISADLTNAAEAAKQLGIHLREATNVNTGQLDLSKFNQSIQKSGSSLDDLMTKLAMGGSAGASAFDTLTASIAKAQVPLRQTNALLQNMATTLKNTVKWELSSSLVHGLIGTLTGAVSYAKNLNSSLTNIRIVTNASIEDMATFAKEANVAAKALSTTTKAYADASLIYYQQGDNAEQVAKKAALTIKAANASFNTSASEMSEYLTAVWNSYQVGADELERYVDIMAALGAKTATSLEEIATSMQKVAATGNAVGVSMEQVSSIIATVSSVTRESAESIGTSYKTIFARMGDLKLGESLEDGVTLGQVSSTLEKIGVDVLDASGNLREMGGIITDLGDKWQIMNQAQKTAVAQVVAGKRQYTQLMALFENWDMYKDNMAIAEDSEGSLQKMSDIYEESWEAASARVKASTENIFTSLINDQSMIKFTNFINSIVEGIGGAIESLGGLNGVLSLTGSLMLNAFSSKIGASIKNIANSIKNLFVSPKNDFLATSTLAKTALENNNIKEQTNGYIQLIEVKNRLLSQEQYMSEAQKQGAEAMISHLQQQVVEIKTLEDAYVRTAASAKTLSTTAIQIGQRQYGQSTLDQYVLNEKENIEKIQQQYNLLQQGNSYANLSSAYQKSNQLYHTGTITGGLLDPQEFANIPDAAQFERIKSAAQQMQEAIKNTNYPKGFVNEINRIANMDSADWQTLEIERQSRALSNLRVAAQQLDSDGMQSFLNLENIFRRIIQRLRELGVSDDELAQLQAAFSATGEAGSDMANDFQRLSSIVNNFKNDVDRTQNSLDDSKFKFEKFAQGFTQLGSGALSLANQFTSINNLIARWGDESTTTADKIGGLTSSVLSLGMALPMLINGLKTAFSLATPWAALIAVGATAITGIAGAISGKNEADRKAEQKAFESRQSKLTQNYDTYTEEAGKTQELLSNYVSLYNAFKAGDDVQQELITSAQSLAEAYGLTADAVAMASGNFTDFNNQVQETLNFSKELQDLNNLIWSSGQQIDRQTFDFKESKKTLNQYINDSGVKREQNDDGTYGAVWAGNKQGSERILNNFLNSSMVDFLLKIVKAEKNTGNSDLIELMDTNRFTDKQKDALGIRRGWAFGKETEYADLYNAVQTLTEEELRDIFGQDTVADLFDFNKVKSSSQPTLQKLAIDKGLIDSESLTNMDTIMAEGIEKKLVSKDDNGYYSLQWDESASIDEKVANYNAFAEWKNNLLLAQDEAIKAGNDFLSGFYETLIEQIDIVVEDESLKANVDIYETSAERKQILETVKNTLPQLLDEGIINFGDYTKVYDQILNEIDNNQQAFKTLKDLNQGTEEYIQARKKIADSIVADYGGLEDFAAIYNVIAANWHAEDWSTIAQQIADLGITDANQLTGAIISAIKTGDKDIKHQINLSQKGQKASDYLSEYEALPEYKAGMDFDDASALASAYDWGSIDELSGIRIASWEEFTKMETNARASYLEGLNRQLKENALDIKQQEYDELKTLYDADKDAFETIYGKEGDASLIQMQADYDEFMRITGGKVSLGANGEIRTSFDEDDAQQEAQYEEKYQDEATTRKLLEYGRDVENISAQEINLESLLNLTRAYQLMGDTIDETAIAMQEIERHQNNLNVDLNALPQKGTAAWNRLTMSVRKYGKEQKSLNDMTREEQITAISDAKIKAAEEAKQLFLMSTDWSDEANYEKNLQQLIELVDAIDVARQEKEDALLDLEVEKVEKAIAQAEKTISDLEKIASETREKADILGSAIETGELTEEQKASAGLTETEISTWEIADAQKRAQIAANAYSKAYIAERAVLDKQQQGILSAQSLFPEGKTLDVSKFFDTDTGALKDISTLLAENVFGDNLTNEAKKALSDVWGTISGSINQSSTGQEIVSLITGALTDDNNEISKALLVLAGQYKDTVAGAFSGVAQQMMDEAQSAANAWMDAFEQIAEARQKLFKGESLLDDIAGDPAKLLQYALAAGVTPEVLTNKVLAGDLKGEDLKYPDYQKFKENQLAMYGLDQKTIEGIAFGSENKYMDTRALGYKDSRDGWVDAEGNKVEQAAINSALEEYYTAILQATGITEKEARAHAQEIIAGTREYKELSTARQGLVASIDQSAKAQEARTAEQDALAQIEKASDLTKLEIDKKTGKIEGTDEVASVMGKVGDYEEYTRLQEAISKAQDAKYAGKSWESLDTADRELLEQYNIDFSNVDTAAVSCADALAACASAALALAQAAAGDAGFAKNADGVYERSGYMVDGQFYTEQEGEKAFGLDWQEVRGEKIVQTSPELTESINTLEDASETARQTAMDVPVDNWNKRMEGFGLDPSEVDKYGDALQDMAETAEDIDDRLKDDAKAADNLAKSLMRGEKAVEAINSSYKDWLKTAESSNKGYKETVKLAEQVGKSLGDLMDLEEDYFDLTKEEDIGFLTNPDTIKQMKKVADGVEGAEDDMIKALTNFKGEALGVSQDVIDAFTEMGQELNDLPAGMEIEIGSDARVSENFHNALNTAVQSLYNANGELSAGVAEANAILGALGDGAGFDVEVVPADAMVEGATYYTPILATRNIGAGGTPVSVITGWEPVTSADGDFHGIAYKVTNSKGSSGGRVNGGGGGSKGGGGGGNKKQKKEPKRYQDETERYHRNNSAIKQVENELKKLTAEKDAAYGKNYVDAIDAETAALRREREEQEKLRQEALSYKNTDAAKLIAAGAQIGENGVIENYDDLMQSWIDEYNAAVDAWNNSDQDEDDQEKFDEANQLYEDRLQLIQDYEDALDTAADAEARLQEILNEISENTLEGITYTLELELEVNERDLELLEYYREQYEDTLEDQDNLFANLMQQANEYETNFASLQNAYNNLMAEYNSGNLQEDEYAEGLADLHSQILENLQNLQDVKEQIAEVYSNALDLATEEVENATEALDHMNETMEAYIAIMGLSGRETDYATMQAFYDAQFATNMANIEVQTKMLAGLKEQEEYFKNRKEQNGELTDLEEKEYNDLMKKIRETESAVLESTQTTLEVLRAGYENTINRIAQELDEFMAGAAGSISHLQEQYAYFQEEQGRYVSTAKELYEVSSLNRDIENTLAETTSAASKEALKALQEKINKQSELNEMTEYDIEMNQLEYQLLLARIQLEEAQNSKDTVRLTRDDNGNYAYQYTADEDKVSEAMQNYEDTLQQMNDVTVERTSEIEQQMINSMAEYKEKMQEIAMDTTLSESEKYNRLLELQSQFDAEMAYLQEQAGIANENLLANQEAIASHYGVNITEITSSTAGNVNQTVQDMIANAQEYSQAMHNALFGPEGVSQSWSEYLAAITTVQQASGTTVGNMLNNTANVGEVNEDAVQAALDAIEALTGTLEPINQMTEAWEAHQTALQGTIDSYEDLLVHINDLMAALGQTSTNPNLDPEDTNTNANTNANTSTRAAPTLDGSQEEGVVDETNAHTEDLMPNEEIFYEHSKPDGKKTPQYGREYFEEVTADSLAAAGDYTDDLMNKIDEISDHYVEAFVKITEDEELAESEKYKQILELQNIFDEEMETLHESHKKQQLEYANLIDESEKMYDLWLNQIDALTRFSMLNNYHAQGLINEAPVVIDQNVTIEAEFPNVSSTDEIIEAFNELINRAAQFASAKK